MGFFSDVDNSKAFQTAEEETNTAINHVKTAVQRLHDAVHGLDVKGDFATQWKAATVNFDESTTQCQTSCRNLAEAVRTHGQSTDTANANATQGYTNLARGASGLV
jgi:hypothetical protein